MLKIIFTCFLFSVVVSTIHCQQEWAPSGSKWHYNIGINFDTFPPVHPLAGFYELSYNGDTMINGLLMKKIGEYLMLQEGGQIYYWQYEALRLIYDFDVALGDTVTFEKPACGLNEVLMLDHVIVNIDSIWIDTLPLKRIEAMPIEGDSLSKYLYIEKIGSLKSLVETECNYILTYQPAWLRCYEDNETSYRSDRFLSYEEEDCEVISVITDTKQPVLQPQIKIYPNPTSQEVGINLSEYAYSTKFIALSVLDANGSIIFSEPISNQLFTVNITHLPAGLYFLLFRTQNSPHLITQKLLIK